jgi:hypothetical protein
MKIFHRSTDGGYTVHKSYADDVLAFFFAGLCVALLVVVLGSI